MRIAQRVVMFLAVLLSQRLAHAQTVPFGKNKIQYQDFEWRVLPGEHVDVYYYPEEEDVARLALEYAEESYDFLERIPASSVSPHSAHRLLVRSAFRADQRTSRLHPGGCARLHRVPEAPGRAAVPRRLRPVPQHAAPRAGARVPALQDRETTAMHPRHAARVTPQQIHWWTEGLAEFWSSEQTSEDDMFIRDLVVRGSAADDRAVHITSYSYMSYPLGAELHKYLDAALRRGIHRRGCTRSTGSTTPSTKRSRASSASTSISSAGNGATRSSSASSRPTPIGRHSTSAPTS